jgi:hypothetical protein
VARVTGHLVPSSLAELWGRLATALQRHDRPGVEVRMLGRQVRLPSERVARLWDRLLRESAGRVAALSLGSAPRSVVEAAAAACERGLRFGEPPGEYFQELALVADRTYLYEQLNRYEDPWTFNRVTRSADYPSSEAGEPGKPVAGMRAEAAGAPAEDQWYAARRLVWSVGSRTVGGWHEVFPGDVWLVIECRLTARAELTGNRNQLALWVDRWWTEPGTVAHVNQVVLASQKLRMRPPARTAVGGVPWEETVWRRLVIPAWWRYRAVVSPASRVEAFLLPAPAWDTYHSGNSWLESELEVVSARAFCPHYEES